MSTMQQTARGMEVFSTTLALSILRDRRKHRRVAGVPTLDLDTTINRLERRRRELGMEQVRESLAQARKDGYP